MTNPYEGGISINDFISLDELKAILPETSFTNLQHLLMLRSKIDTLKKSYEAAIVATGNQLYRDEVIEDHMITLYKFLKNNDVVGRSILVEAAGYNSNQLSYCARNETQMHPRKGIHCVYLLLKENQVVYIGRSSNLKARLKQHKKDKDFDSSQFYRCESFNDSRDLEAVLIQQHRPTLNLRIEKRSGL